MNPFHHVVFARCRSCPASLPPCTCQANEQCVSTTNSCDTCATNSCVPIADSAPASTKTVSSGAIAGAVIAGIVFLAVIALAFLWYRRRQRLLRQASTSTPETKSEAPARAEDVLNRPDPHKEKPDQPQPQELQSVRIYGGASHATINLDPESRGDSMAATNGHIPERHSTQSNPFADAQSIQSASTGTRSNVIPIALVPHGSVSMLSGPSSTKATQGSVPARPERSPEVDLGLKPAGASNQLAPLTGKMDANSTRSGVTANFRNSYMTTGSFASDIMNEAPVIVTPTRGTVKQVVGVVRAEVIHPPSSAGTGSVYSTDEQGTPKTASSLANRPSIRSPLAKNNAFGPMDSMAEEPEHNAEAEGQELSVRQNPFSDEYSPYRSDAPSSPAPAPSPAATTATFGESEEQHWDPQSPRLPWKKERERPSSAYTQAASIIDANIGTASRVHLGLNQLSPQSQTTGRSLLSAPPPSTDLPVTPNSAPLSTRSQYRMTSAKLVSPATTNPEATPLGGTLARQQKKAFENLDARMSQASVVSSASTRADSILEGFHFVPPSPISDRPLRTPPRSPLAQQAFSDASSAAVNSSAPSRADADPLAPPNRKTLGMSTGSQLSTMSNGLGSFPFQIDAGSGASTEAASSPPSSFTSMGRQRASLDTLALTSDLSSYPLGFDRNEAMQHYPGRR